MKKENNTTVHFQIKAVELLGLELNRIKVDNSIQEEFKYTFDINIEQRCVTEKNAVLIITSIGIYSDKEKNKFLGSIITNCVFEVVGLEKFIDKKNKKTLFSDSQTAKFNSLAISTTRGIMVSEFKGTYLNNAILPIVDMSSLKPQKK